MAGYIGSKCIVCDKEFTKNDEIVVCPECGTPYHRDCYFKEEKCINNELHKINGTWNPTLTSDSHEMEEIKCSRCGETNPPSGIFCSKCGLPLHQTQQSNPFPRNPLNIPPNFDEMFSNDPNIDKTMKFTAESDLDGIKIKDINNYVGANALFFLPHFIKFSKFKTKISMNMIAMFLPEYYFFYRKMNVIGAIVFIFKMLVSIPVMLEMFAVGTTVNSLFSDLTNMNITEEAFNTFYIVLNYLSYIQMFICGTLANFIYYKKMVNDINKIKRENNEGNDYTDLIREKGGVSKHGVTMAVLAQLLLIFAILLIVYFM